MLLSWLPLVLFLASASAKATTDHPPNYGFPIKNSALDLVNQKVELPNLTRYLWLCVTTEGWSSVIPVPAVIWAITLGLMDVKTHPVSLEWGFLAITTINQDYLIRSLETYLLCWNSFTSTPEGPLFSNLTNSQKVVYSFRIISNLSSGPNVGLLQPWQCNSTFHVQVQVSLNTSVGITSMNGHTTAVTNLLLSPLGTPVKPLFPIPSKQTYFGQGWPTTHTFMSPLLKQSCSILFT